MARNINEISPTVADKLHLVFNGESPWPLLITGGVGAGKTCAALCMLDRVPKSRKYIPATDFVDRAMQSAKSELEVGGYRVSENQWWSDWGGYNITCMDEIGTRDKVSDWQYDVFKKAIEKRHGKPSIWISNLSLKQLAIVYDDRIASRLCEGTVLNIQGPDRRVMR